MWVFLKYNLSGVLNVIKRIYNEYKCMCWLCGFNMLLNFIWRRLWIFGVLVDDINLLVYLLLCVIIK